MIEMSLRLATVVTCDYGQEQSASFFVEFGVWKLLMFTILWLSGDFLVLKGKEVWEAVPWTDKEECVVLALQTQCSLPKRQSTLTLSVLLTVAGASDCLASLFHGSFMLRLVTIHRSGLSSWQMLHCSWVTSESKESPHHRKSFCE